MNVENILRVADAIEKHEIADLGFNMGTWLDPATKDAQGHPCGTVGCVAGHAYVVAKGRIDYSDMELPDVAREYLGLDETDADALFEPLHIAVRDWISITPAQAVRTLRHLAATGEVVWDQPEEVA